MWDRSLMAVGGCGLLGTENALRQLSGFFLSTVCKKVLRTSPFSSPSSPPVKKAPYVQYDTPVLKQQEKDHGS